MAPALADFLAEAEAWPAGREALYCCLFPCEWVRRRTGIDPAAPWRDRHADLDAAMAEVHRRGGMAAVFTEAARNAGLVRVHGDRAEGDVGLIARHGELIGAVCLGRRTWATAAPEGGVWAGVSRSACVWRIP